ncbi:clasp N terminal-domain-containing protein [Chytridium lagenaria]|nr:clasp N terminal-domain-containing protein [Chytridium lagenaria]
MHSPKLRLTNSLNQGDDLNGVDAEIKHIVAAFEAKETEENWTQFDDALVKLKTLVRNNGSLQGFNTLLKRFKQPLNTSLSSERTKLARTGLSLVECLSEELGERLDGNIDILLPPVLKLCNRANKVFVSCASATLKVIIDNTRLPSILPYLYDALHNPTKTLRIAASDGFVKCLDAVPPHRLTNSQDLIESFIKESAEDSAAEVRESARQVLLKFRETFPNRVDRFISELNGAATKNLKIPKQDANKRVPIKQKLIALREVGVKAPLEDRIEIASSQGHPPPTQYQEINQDFSDLKVRGTQQVPIPGSTHGLSSRRLLERPTRVVHGETNVAAAGLPTRETTAWGAQRVLRDETLKAFLPLEVSERPVPLKSKAMRVPSAAIFCRTFFFLPTYIPSGPSKSLFGITYAENRGKKRPTGIEKTDSPTL